MILNWRSNEDPNGYRIFTRKYDVVADGDSLFLDISDALRRDFESAVFDYERIARPILSKASVNGIEVVDQIRLACGSKLQDTALTVLVDHSGSMKGQKAIIACLVVQVVAEMLSRLRVNFEILGFTTVEWKGGLSRKRWRGVGRPKNPGRLNDTLHIVYRSFESKNPGAPYAIRNLLRHDLLKENIDGEALFWATERMKNYSQSSNIILLISDGAPADDSTVVENGPDFLYGHLKNIVRDIHSTPGFKSASVGIDYVGDNIYQNFLDVRSVSDVVDHIPEFIAEVLI